MLPSELARLPAWARYRTFAKDDPRGEEGHVMIIDDRVNVEIEADRAYPAVLAQYRALYEAQGRPDFIGVEEWPTVFAELEPDDEDVLSAYWLETAYQTMKLDVQRVTGFALNLHIKHETAEGKERYRQKTSPPGYRGPQGATSGPRVGHTRGGNDARHHYKKLRGFLIA